jgi:hypothetical protein
VSQIVIVLGAGASKQAGAPLMADFLDVAADLLRQERVQDARDDFAAVIEARAELQQVHSKAQLDLLNLEAVFAALEMARTLGGFSKYRPEDAERLVHSLRKVIVKTLERTIFLPVRQTLLPPPPYGEFAKLCKGLRDARPPQSVSVITFNYDVGADYGFTHNNMAIDYGLGEDASPNAVPVLKLHGSLNWAQCNKCNRIVPWTLPMYLAQVRIGPGGPSRGVNLPIGSQLETFKHCDAPVGGDPVLVPPTWNKTEYHRSLRSVWSRAATELRAAESILVFGFSLAASDAFFSYLYALGTAGGPPLRRFWVFDPDPAVENRFRLLLGSGAERRFRFFREPFDVAIETVSKELGTKQEGGGLRLV